MTNYTINFLLPSYCILSQFLIVKLTKILSDCGVIPLKDLKSIERNGYTKFLGMIINEKVKLE